MVEITTENKGCSVGQAYGRRATRLALVVAVILASVANGCAIQTSAESRCAPTGSTRFHSRGLAFGQLWSPGKVQNGGAHHKHKTGLRCEKESPYRSAASLQPRAKFGFFAGKQVIPKLGALAAAFLALVWYLSPTVAIAASKSAAAAGRTLSSTSAPLRQFFSFLPAGFIEAFSLVLVSEIGDKTFFVAALYAMKTSRLVSFLGSLGALIAMSAIAVTIGQIFYSIPPIPILQGVKVDQYVAVGAFLYFGFKLLRDSYLMPDRAGMDNELNEAAVEVGKTARETRSSFSLMAQAFSLVFAAEIGDRSFLATIALSTAFSPMSVVCGAVAGHSMATGLAVISGAWLARYLSEKMIGYIGGSLFVLFALTTAIGIF